MRKRRNVILGLAVASWLAIACSTGPGVFSTLDDGYDRPPSSRDNPGSGRETPNGAAETPLTSGHEQPPPSWENPGQQGGSSSGGSSSSGSSGSSSGGSGCPRCDTKLDCTTGGGGKQSVSLKTVNGACSAGDGVTLDCAGNVMQNGTTIGSWQGSGDTYTVTVSQQGQTQTLTCTTKAPSTTNPPGTGTGTSPAPTGTTPPIGDAGPGR